MRYDTSDILTNIRRALDNVESALTATVHIGADKDAVAVEIADIVEARAGRIIFNGFPTGVAVSVAQTHGGPWPGTNSLHTSVGATAIRRFLRPLTYQNAPIAMLPQELRDDYTGIPRLVDGKLLAARSTW